jgi:hypothetical protein
MPARNIIPVRLSQSDRLGKLHAIISATIGMALDGIDAADRWHESVILRRAVPTVVVMRRSPHQAELCTVGHWLGTRREFVQRIQAIKPIDYTNAFVVPSANATLLRDGTGACVFNRHGAEQLAHTIVMSSDSIRNQGFGREEFYGMRWTMAQGGAQHGVGAKVFYLYWPGYESPVARIDVSFEPRIAWASSQLMNGSDECDIAIIEVDIDDFVTVMFEEMACLEAGYYSEASTAARRQAQSS